MKKFILIALVLLFSKAIYSQSVIVGDTVVLKRGMYKNFEEFKYNRPSIEFKYKISRERKSTGINVNRTVTYYTINIDYQEGKEIGSVYGFCDGRNVYVREKMNTLDNRTGFLLLHNIGQYCYYEDLIGASINMGNSPVSSFELVQIAIDILTGERIILTKNKVRQLIQSDSLLLSEFNSKIPDGLDDIFNTYQKTNLLKEYIIKYSEKYKNKIDFNKILSLKEIENNLYKSDQDSDFDAYYERILSYEPYPYFDELELYRGNYSNGTPKYIGIIAKYKLESFDDSYYKIGTWREFYKNDKVKSIIDYNLKQQIHGKYQIYNKKGVLTEDKKFVKDKEQK